jgi:hypothetical protein
MRSKVELRVHPNLDNSAILISMIRRLAGILCVGIHTCLGRWGYVTPSAMLGGMQAL